MRGIATSKALHTCRGPDNPSAPNTKKKDQAPLLTADDTTATPHQMERLGQYVIGHYQRQHCQEMQRIDLRAASAALSSPYSTCARHCGTIHALICFQPCYCLAETLLHGCSFRSVARLKHVAHPAYTNPDAYRHPSHPLSPQAQHPAAHPQGQSCAPASSNRLTQAMRTQSQQRLCPENS